MKLVQRKVPKVFEEETVSLLPEDPEDMVSPHEDPISICPVFAVSSVSRTPYPDAQIPFHRPLFLVTDIALQNDRRCRIV